MKITLKNSEPIIASFRSAAYQVRQTPVEVVRTQRCLPPSSHTEEDKINIRCISSLPHFEETCYKSLAQAESAILPRESGLSRREKLKKVLTDRTEWPRINSQLSTGAFDLFLTRFVDNYLTHKI